MEISKKVAYLQGLIDGLKIDEDSKEGQILIHVVQLLQDIADELEDLQLQQEDLEDYMNIIDEDLYDLEDEVYNYDDECDCEPLDDDYIEVECPECGDTVCFEADILDDDNLIEVSCPNCDTVVFTNEEENDEFNEEDEDI